MPPGGPGGLALAGGLTRTPRLRRLPAERDRRTIVGGRVGLCLVPTALSLSWGRLGGRPGLLIVGGKISRSRASSSSGENPIRGGAFCGDCAAPSGSDARFARAAHLHHQGEEETRGGAALAWRHMRCSIEVNRQHSKTSAQGGPRLA